MNSRKSAHDHSFEFTCEHDATISNSLVSMMLLFLMLAMSTRTLLAQNVTGDVQLETTSFRITNFSGPELEISGDTIVQNDGSLWMTANRSGVSGTSFKSRAVYAAPVLIFDAATETAASFNTSFTFAIVSSNGTKGDGMTFLLTADPQVPASIYSAGGTLALYDVLRYNASNSSIHTVAVEFDTYSSPDVQDPPGDHVGVDINSFTSAAAKSLQDTPFSSLNTSSAAQLLTAWIDYDAVVGQLDVFLAAAASPSKASATQVLSYGPLALAQYLLNRSYVGFTAATGSSYEIHVVSEWNFSSTLVSNPLLSSPQPPVLAPLNPGSGASKKKTSSSAGIIAGVVLGGAGTVFAVLLVVLLLGRRRRKRKSGGVAAKRKFSSERLSAEDVASSWTDLYAADVNYGPRRFSYEELSAATNNFDAARLLGHGGFGNVYKGEIPGAAAAAGSTIPVAVKRVSQASKQGEREFRAEVLSIGRLRHRNLVPLLGWCHDQGELLLVYELMPHGSLDRWLHSQSQKEVGKEVKENTLGLGWTERYNILCGVATALSYLHVEWEQCIIHRRSPRLNSCWPWPVPRDIKASNVLLDANLNARLGDFGLARMVDHRKAGDLSNTSTTAVVGTRGYLAPEMAITGKATKESDIFSFGVLALVVATGRRPYVPVDNDEELVDWVWSMHERTGLMEVVDVRLAGVFDKDQAHRVLQVGLLCTHPDPKTRLPTENLLQALRGDIGHGLPQLPRCRPVAVYLNMFPTPPDSQVSNLVSRNSQDLDPKLVQEVEEISTSHPSTFTSEKSHDFSSSASQTLVTRDELPTGPGEET